MRNPVNILRDYGLIQAKSNPFCRKELFRRTAILAVKQIDRIDCTDMHKCEGNEGDAEEYDNKV